MKNAKYKIEDDVPLPLAHAHRYAFLHEMKPGQSVLFGKGMQGAARIAARLAFGRGAYAVRTMKDGVRVWRLK